MNDSLQTLAGNLQDVFGDAVIGVHEDVGELTVEVHAGEVLRVARGLRDNAKFGFEQLIDVCGIDYLEYGEGRWQGPRFAVVYHLLSVSRNLRLRMRAFLHDDPPIVSSVTGIWAAANWFEREAFDLFGIVFEGHADLRRILTDYGFIGHPFRKDFPLIGQVEMRYDPEQQRVIYQPVSIEPRVLVPRVIRDDGYADRGA